MQKPQFQRTSESAVDIGCPAVESPSRALRYETELARGGVPRPNRQNFAFDVDTSRAFLRSGRRLVFVLRCPESLPASKEGWGCPTDVVCNREPQSSSKSANSTSF